MRVSGELSFINDLRHLFRSHSGRGVVLGIGDDAALLRVRAGWQAVVTTDLLMEGRHFRRDTHLAESVGYRCLARGLSDLAAMGGAEPIAAFLSLALPAGALESRGEKRWISGFLSGFAALSRRFGAPLAGGDTGEAPGRELLADVVLVGQIKPEWALRRSGAEQGDGIWVTGALGGAAAELEGMLARAAAGKRPSRVRGPQSFPEPRLAVGRTLGWRAGEVTACLDVSDGLSTDLGHLCEESGVGARIEAQRLPVHDLAMRLRSKRGMDRVLDLAVNGGEDYELLFTAKEGARLPKTIAGVPLTRIGTVLKRPRKGPMMTMVGTDGVERELKRGGWEHLR